MVEAAGRAGEIAVTPSACHRRQYSCGFTLVEVLISIVVVTILIAIGLPSISRTRESARRAQCLLQLRSLGQAIEMYRGANNDLLPHAVRQVDARLDELDPLPALSAHLDVTLPVMSGQAGVIARPPFVCPSDDVIGSSKGFSYSYSPIDLMALFPRSVAQRVITAYLSRDPSVIILHDLDAWHAGARPHAPLTGKNALRLDGGAEAGCDRLSVNPKR